MASKGKSLCLILFSLLSVLGVVFAEPQISYPLIFSSYREVSTVHADINELRKQRNGGVTSKDEAYRLMSRMYASCPVDTYLFIDQPGIRIEDFQKLRTDYHHITLWENLKSFLGRVGTLGSFPRLDQPIDLNKLEHMLKRQCNAIVIEADIYGDQVVEQYTDTTPRIIRLNLPPLPETEPERTVALKQHDELIFEAFKKTPSPFFGLVYASSTGEEFDPENEYFKQSKHWDIFSDLVRLKRDPRNREEYKKDERHSKTVISNEPISRVPPLAEKQKRDQRRAWLEKAKGKEELYLSKETVGTILVFGIGTFILYTVFKSVFFSINGAYYNSVDMSQTPTKLNDGEEDAKKDK